MGKISNKKNKILFYNETTIVFWKQLLLRKHMILLFFYSFVSSAYTKVEFQVEFLSEFKQEELIKSNSIMLDKASKNEWLYFTVRVHIQEKLIRFGIDNRFFEHSQKIQAINKFPVDGVLRIAQLTISGNENIPEISNRFLVSTVHKMFVFLTETVKHF